MYVDGGDFGSALWSTYLTFPCPLDVVFWPLGAVGDEEGGEGPLWLLCSAEGSLLLLPLPFR